MSAPPTPQRPALRQQPKNAGRRSKEEREKLERDAEKQRKMRQDAAAADAAAETARRKERERGMYGIKMAGQRPSTSSFRPRRGRGGFMGTRPDVSRGLEAPIPKDETTAAAEEAPKARKPRSASSRGRETKSGRGVEIKKDPDSDVVSSDLSARKLVPTDGGYISSDPDEGDEGPRQDVNSMVFSEAKAAPDSSEDEVEQDDDESDEGGPVRNRLDQRTASLPPPTQIPLPVRIQRRPHTDRKIIINQSSSALSYLESRRVNDETNAEAETMEAPGARRKGKGRAKEVHFAGDSKGSRAFKVKPDQHDAMDEDLTLADAQELAQDAEAGLEPDSQKPLPKRSGRIHTPKFATVEEEDEWRLHQRELRDLRDELGPLSTTKRKTKKRLETDDDTLQLDARANNVYLFQLPPVLPDLHVVEPPKVESQSPDLSRYPATDAPPSTTANTSSSAVASSSTKPVEESIKIEDDVDSAQAHRPNGVARKPSLASGRIGKLRIHESGRATLSWGGTSMELSMGMSAHFLQTAVLADILAVTETGTTSDGFSGDVVSFGQVRGKFVVTPDWKEMLG